MILHFLCGANVQRTSSTTQQRVIQPPRMHTPSMPALRHRMRKYPPARWLKVSVLSVLGVLIFHDKFAH